jgi:hypothetical protein
MVGREVSKYNISNINQAFRLHGPLMPIKGGISVKPFFTGSPDKKQFPGGWLDIVNVFLEFPFPY